MSAIDTEPSRADAVALPTRHVPPVGSGSWRRGKRILDVVVAGILLVLLSPLLLLIAIVVRCETPGPALFRQDRYGQGLWPFVVLKFRTMHHNASPEPHRRFIAKLAAGGDD